MFPIRFLILVFALFVGGCSSNSLCKESELQRGTSPDGRVEFIVTQKNCGATTANSTNVYLIPDKGTIEAGTQILTVDRVEKLKVIWNKERLLWVSFEKGRIFRFTNFWQSAGVDNFKYLVGIQIQYPENALR